MGKDKFSKEILSFNKQNYTTCLRKIELSKLNELKIEKGKSDIFWQILSDLPIFYFNKHRGDTIFSMIMNDEIEFTEKEEQEFVILIDKQDEYVYLGCKDNLENDFGIVKLSARQANAYKDARLEGKLDKCLEGKFTEELQQRASPRDIEAACASSLSAHRSDLGLKSQSTNKKTLEVARETAENIE